VSKTDKPPPKLLVPDPIQAMRESGKSPELAGLLAWLIPGAGHIYAGYKVKGIGAMILVLGLFVVGVGTSRGECVSLRDPQGHKFAFMGQIGAGLPTFLALAYNHDKIPGLHPGFLELLERPGGVEAPEFAAQLPRNDTGLLFTMIAGLLNLLLVHDAISGVPGAIGRRVQDERRRRKLEKLRVELSTEAAQAEPKEGEVVQAEGETPEAETPEAETPEAEATEAEATEAEATEAESEPAKAETAASVESEPAE
jgi:hypothetical protein